MDTIVYLCDTAKTPDYEIKKYAIQDYQLIRVALGEMLTAACPSGRKDFSEKGFWYRAFSGWTDYQFARQRKRIIRQLREEIQPLLNEWGNNQCVNASRKRTDICEIIPLPQFEDWFEGKWIQRMLPYAVCPHFIVLGNAPALPEQLMGIADRMKSLTWIVPEDSCVEKLEEFSEEFYRETGIAIDLRSLGEGKSYRHLQLNLPRGGEPVNFLDFIQERYIPHIVPPEGSIWLDMTSEEEKERRLQARGLKVTYLSLRKQWRRL